MTPHMLAYCSMGNIILKQNIIFVLSEKERSYEKR